MLRKDLILRQFEEFGKVLASILTYKKQQDWDKFEAEIALATKKFTGTELSETEALSDEEFDQKIINNDALAFEQKKILASILFEKMSYYGLLGQEENQSKLIERCLNLYTFLHTNQTENEFNLEVHYRLNLLKTL